MATGEILPMILWKSPQGKGSKPHAHVSIRKPGLSEHADVLFVWPLRSARAPVSAADPSLALRLLTTKEQACQ